MASFASRAVKRLSRSSLLICPLPPRLDGRQRWGERFVEPGGILPADHDRNMVRIAADLSAVQMTPAGRDVEEVACPGPHDLAIRATEHASVRQPYEQLFTSRMDVPAALS